MLRGSILCLLAHQASAGVTYSTGTAIKQHPDYTIQHPDFEAKKWPGLGAYGVNNWPEGNHSSSVEIQYSSTSYDEAFNNTITGVTTTTTTTTAAANSNATTTTTTTTGAASNTTTTTAAATTTTTAASSVNVTNETTAAGSSIDEVGFETSVSITLLVPGTCSGKLQLGNVLVFSQKLLLLSGGVSTSYASGATGNCAEDGGMTSGKTSCIYHAKTGGVEDTSYEYKISNGYNTIKSGSSCSRRLTVGRQLTSMDVSQTDTVMLKVVVAPNAQASSNTLFSAVTTAVTSESGKPSSTLETELKTRMSEVVQAFQGATSTLQLPAAIPVAAILSGEPVATANTATATPLTTAVASAAVNVTVNSAAVAAGSTATTSTTSSGLFSKQTAGFMSFLASVIVLAGLC